MAKDSIDVNGFEDSLFNEDFLTNSFNDIFGRFGNKIQEDLRASLDKGTGRYPDGHNSTGTLNRSIEVKPEIFGLTGFSWQLKLADYYDDLDQGRKAGKEPPLAPILEWVKNKSVFGGLEVKDVNSKAFQVQKNIGKFGTQPTYWFTKVVEDGRLEELTKELAESIGKNIILKDGNN